MSFVFEIQKCQAVRPHAYKDTMLTPEKGIFAILEMPLIDAKTVRKQIKSFKIEQKAILLKIDKQGFRHVAHSLRRVSLATPQSCVAGQLNAELLLKKTT